MLVHCLISNIHNDITRHSIRLSPTSFPGSLFFPPNAIDGKKRDPGNEVGLSLPKVKHNFGKNTFIFSGAKIIVNRGKWL